MSSTVNESMPTSTTQNCTKTLYLIRHGQSLANRDLAETIEYQDAGLTDQGITQARGLQQHLETLDLELVVVSPLTRALQTCDSALPASYSGVVIVHPKIHETCDSYYSCGQKRAIIQRDFAKFDWSHVPENNVWWWPFDEHGKSEPTESAHERICKFKQWIQERAETRIAIFSHGDFLYDFMDKKGLYLENCQVRAFSIA